MRPLADAGRVFFHYDFYAHALSKLERGHDKDLLDAGHMVRSGRVKPEELLRLFEEIEPRLYRYPAIDPATFRRAVEKFLETRSTAEL